MLLRWLQGLCAKLATIEIEETVAYVLQYT